MRAPVSATIGMLAPGGRVQTHVQGQPFLLLSVDRVVDLEGFGSNLFRTLLGPKIYSKSFEEWNEKLVRVCPNFGEPSP